MTINGTDITMIRGDTESLTITCKDEDGVLRPFEAGDRVTLTVAFRVGGEAVLKKTAETFLDGAAVFCIAHEDTNDLQAMAYRYDVQLTTKTGVVKTIIPPSEFRLEGDVTRE